MHDYKEQVFSIAVVCASNQNRSMNAHSLLKESGYKVESYGTSSHVKLPGKKNRDGKRIRKRENLFFLFLFLEMKFCLLFFIQNLIS